MRKFLAVVKHEYKKIILKWSFLIGTLLLPVLFAGFAVVPAIIFSIKGEPTRIAVVDLTGKIAARLKENLSAERIAEKIKQTAQDSLTNIDASQQEQLQRSAAQLGASFVFTDYDFAGKSLEQIRRELSDKVIAKELDGYLIIPNDLNSADAKYEFRSRKAGDFGGERNLRDALNEAVRSERLAGANISEAQLRSLSRNVDFDSKSLDEKGDEKDSDGVFLASLAIGLMIYLTLAIYGQAIMAAVVEEKETRIAEILFSSAKPFELMMGKLVGVGLAGLTQLAIWIISALVLVGVGVAQMSAAGVSISIPNITPLMVVYFFIFFLLGFFIYASIFALIGSMVTTVQEGSQFAFPPIMLLLIGFYFSFAVIRDPGSPLSFWVSIAPFFAPITMPVRILSETPPFWEIALSIAVNGLAIAGLVWLAARVYRVGMLMYGKRATIPEVWKWIRQS
ncbi:MAG TPA: ABC transporter permease [Pyrinomonadaceae bacterium]|jgi:ABC-2 type transport system permease protein